MNWIFKKYLGTEEMTDYDLAKMSLYSETFCLFPVWLTSITFYNFSNFKNHYIDALGRYPFIYFEVTIQQQQQSPYRHLSMAVQEQ